MTSPSSISVNFANDSPHSVSLLAWLMSSCPRFMVDNFPVGENARDHLTYFQEFAFCFEENGLPDQWLCVSLAGDSLRFGSDFMSGYSTTLGF